MKKLNLLFLSALFMGIFMAAGPAYAYSYSGAWVSTSNNSQTVSWSISTSNVTGFGVNNSSGGSMELLNGSKTSATFSVTFDANLKAYVLTNSDTSAKLNLGGSDSFYFYFQTASGKIYSFDVTPGSKNVYILESGGAKVAAIDVNPVPVPPSALLLGSGVIGLIGFGVRRRRHQLL